MNNYAVILVPLLILVGAINTIQLKLQNIQIVDGRKFFHPFMQTLLMFIGETLVGFVYLYQIKSKKNDVENMKGKKPLAPIRTVLLPTIMDLMSTLLSYTALNMVDSSVWQILRGGNILFTALLSKFILKRIFSKLSIIGCFLTFLGITSVQVVAISFSQESQSKDLTMQLIGTVLLILSILFNSIGLITQKMIFNKYEISAFKMVFLQGLYGLIFILPLTFIFQYVSCPWDAVNCVNIDGELYLENITQYFNDVSDNIFLLVLNFGLILSIAISVPIAVIVSKKISPVSRSLADVCRTVIIWIFGVTLTLTYGEDHHEYQIQNTTIIVNVLKAVGFATMIFGTLMYHELLPCFRKKGEILEKSLLEEDDIEQGLGAKRQG